MTQGLYIWSRTAASNANSDSSINMAEGMAPSAVNDGIRAEMARIAEYRDDTSGQLFTGGSSTAYTLTTFEVFDTLAHLNTQRLSVRFHATNGASPTLNVDSLGAKPIQINSTTAVPVGFLPFDTPVDLYYDNSIGAFIYVGSTVLNTPIGAVMDFAGSSAPALWLLCYGQAISRTTYAALFAVISTTYGVGDGSTTFNLPDYRGRVIAGKDDMGGSAASRIGSVSTDNGTIVGATLGSTGGSSTHSQTSGELATHTHTFTGDALAAHSHTITGAFGAQYSGGASVAPFVQTSSTTTSSVSAGTPSGTNANAGSGTAMAWLQPTIIANKIIFAGV